MSQPGENKLTDGLNLPSNPDDLTIGQICNLLTSSALEIDRLNRVIADPDTLTVERKKVADQWSVELPDWAVMMMVESIRHSAQDATSATFIQCGEYDVTISRHNGKSASKCLTDLQDAVYWLLQIIDRFGDMSYEELDRIAQARSLLQISPTETYRPKGTS